MSKQHYLVAVDGSEWSERAAERAVSLAKQTGADVRLICVINWSGYQPMTLEEIAARPLEKEAEEENVKSKILAPLMDKFADSGVTVSTEFHWGHPVEVIHEQAKAEHVHMIFAGRRGRSRIMDIVLGSVSNSLAHTVGVPLVLVP